MQVVIFGAGPGGYATAISCAKLGATVTLVERAGVGGVCLNSGCIPSKIMKTTAEVMDKFTRANEFGLIMTGDIATDMEKLMVRKEKIIATQASAMTNMLNSSKIRLLCGDGKITGAGQVEVHHANGETTAVAYDKLVIATGTLAQALPFLPFDGKAIISSDDALNLRAVPRSILIVGGGVIGCEFASIFASLGATVTIVEAMPSLLPLSAIDEDSVIVLMREMKKRKINVIVGHTVKSVEHGEQTTVTITPVTKSENAQQSSVPIIIDVEAVLICVGRKANSCKLGLENAGVAVDDKGWILVDEHLQTSVQGIYAVGDILGPDKIMLAHVASTEGIVVAENVMGGKRVMDYNTVPLAIFTTPEIASVGLTTMQAQERGYTVRTESVLMRMLGKAHALGEIAGQTKIVAETKSGKILGVHIVGAHATELIAEGTLAIQTGCTVRELSDTIHAHPTLAEGMLEVAFKLL
ncbi:MAG: dihydrolipoyl dehydrogenase [Deltaproteobacteria bacterium]